jgi:uncharacterized membrane protein YbhN (UPF0104 family)
LNIGAILAICLIFPPTVPNVLTNRGWLVTALKLFVLVVILLAVHRTLRQATHELSQHDWQLRPGWLVLAGSSYALGLVPMAWFWYRTLSSLGQPAPWWPTLQAYFLGHLGKYVPGKALAIVLRVVAVRPWVRSIRIAVVGSTLETLTMMAVGASLAAALSLMVLQLEPWLAAFAAAMAVAAGVPTLPPVARQLARIGLARVKQDSDLSAPPTAAADIDASLQGINLRLLAAGWLAASACWLLLGVSLWATLQAIGAEDVSLVGDLSGLVVVVAFAVVAGFLSMLPGGLGARDAVLMQLLAPLCGDANALIATVLLRLVWLVTEVVVCGILYGVARSMGGFAPIPR